ncbi:MAG: hypothetical protein JW852_01130 [Spirochaetales bacterium]|nr:hypothetical protein [Spirochaetales bacterium]
MKFKLIFILFNIVIIVSFLAIYLMPLIMVDWGHAKLFWGRNWGLPLLFLAVIGLLDAYFVVNWKMFTLLEREDWPALIDHLERRVYEKKMIVSQHVRILVNAYLVRSDLKSIRKLENFVREHRPSMLSRFGLAFGVPYLLENDAERMEGYFCRFIDMKGNDGAWMRFNYAFALILRGDGKGAEAVLAGVCNEKTEPVLTLLSIYLLHSVRPVADHAAIVEEKRMDLKKKFTRERWLREVERSKNSVHVVILQRLIEEATDWLHAENGSDDRTDEKRIH